MTKRFLIETAPFDCLPCQGRRPSISEVGGGTPQFRHEEGRKFFVAGQLFRVGRTHAGVRLYDHGIADFLKKCFAAFPIVYQMEAGGLDPDMLPIE